MFPQPLRRVAAAALLLAAAAPTWAQPKTDGQWRGTAGAAFTTISGNSTSTAFAANADMQRATTSDKVSFGANANYGRSKVNGVNTTTADRWAGFGQYDYNLSPRLFAFGKLGLEGDRLADLDLRSALAGGVGFKVVESPALSFTVFGGAAYVTDRYGSPKTVAGKTADSFSRSSLYIGEESQHQLGTSTTFKQRLEVYPGVSGDKAVISKFTAGLGVAVSSALNLTVGLTHTDNSKPPLGQKRGDTTLFTGINVKFGAE
jgi:putative salt-induced outer membrane protein